MKNFKKIAAIILTGTMVIGSTTMAFAEDSQGVTGEGTSTGHAAASLVNLVLPTITNSNNGYFNYFADPERLIKATGKYNNVAVTLPTSDDTGVYFSTVTANTYANTSQEYTVTNKSSIAVGVSATATAKYAENATHTIALASSASDLSTTTPQIYLGITVGDDTQAVATSGATATATIDGVASNFELISKTDGSYEYKVKDDVAENTWKTTKISMTGAISDMSDRTVDISDYAAPTVEVTWSAMTEDEDAAPTITNATKVSGQAWDYTATFTKGTALALSATGLTAATMSSTVDGTYATFAKITVSEGTATIDSSAWAGASAGDKKYVKFTIDGEEYIVQFTITEE